MPNGLTVRTVTRDSDMNIINRKELLVSESRASRISIYEIDATGTLTYAKSIPTSANMDNFYTDDNVVFLTGSPNVFNRPPTTQIIRFAILRLQSSLIIFAALILIG